MSDTKQPPDIKYPFERLGTTITTALAPLLQLGRELLVELKTLNGHRRETKQTTFDMETAIKARRAWECGDLHCTKCTIAQRLHCLEEHSLLSEARCDEIAKHLHTGEPK